MLALPTVITGFVAFVVLGCGGPPSLDLPTPDEIELLQVASSTGRDTLEIRDARAIERSLEALGALDPGWEEAPPEVPPWEFSLAWSSTSAGVRLVAWLGEEALVANSMQGRPHLRRTLTPAERRALLRDVGLPVPD